MPLVPEKTYSKWFEKDHWMYRQFAYFFCNPIWKKTVPKAFSLCPYFWMSIASFLFLRCLLVPLCMVTVYPFVVLPLKLLVKVSPVVHGALASWVVRLCKKCGPDNPIANAIAPYDLDSCEEECKGDVLRSVLICIAIIVSLGMLEGSMGLVVGDMVNDTGFLNWVAIHFDKIAMALVAVQIFALVTMMYMKNKPVTTWKAVTWFFMLFPKFTLSILVLASVVIGALALTVVGVSIWLWNTGLPNLVYCIMSMAYGAYEIVRSIWLSCGDGQSVVTPFLYGMLTTVFLFCAYRVYRAVQAFWHDFVHPPCRAIHYTSIEDVIFLLADAYVNNEYYSTPLLDHLICNHPKLTDGVRFSVIKTLVLDAIREEMKLNEKFQDLLFSGVYITGATFQVVAERIRRCGLPFSACLANAETPMSNADIFKLLTVRIKRMSKKYGMRKMMNRIVADLPEAQACISAKEEKEPSWLKRCLWFMLDNVAAPFFSILFKYFISPFFSILSKFFIGLVVVALRCGKAAVAVFDYIFDVIRAMKQKACPVVRFRDPETDNKKAVTTEKG